jgi:hypothetical protein
MVSRVLGRGHRRGRAGGCTPRVRPSHAAPASSPLAAGTADAMNTGRYGGQRRMGRRQRDESRCPGIAGCAGPISSRPHPISKSVDHGGDAVHAKRATPGRSPPRRSSFSWALGHGRVSRARRPGAPQTSGPYISSPKPPCAGRKTPSLAIGGSAHRRPITSGTGSTACSLAAAIRNPGARQRVSCVGVAAAASRLHGGVIARAMPERRSRSRSPHIPATAWRHARNPGKRAPPGRGNVAMRPRGHCAGARPVRDPGQCRGESRA